MKNAVGSNHQHPRQTPGPSGVELLVRFRPDTDPPVGSVRNPDGTEQHFSGWLGLLRLLENHRSTPKPPQEDR